jgi:hypothetical protein
VQAEGQGRAALPQRHAAQRVIGAGWGDGADARALQAIAPLRGRQQFARLVIARRPRLAFAAFRLRPGHTLQGILSPP